MEPSTMLALSQSSGATDKFASMVPSAMKTGVGIAQMAKGKKLRDQYDRPVYETPEEAERALGTAEMMAFTEMPGLGRREEQIAGRTANVGQQVAETGQDSAAKLKAITGLHQNEMNTMNDLAVAEAGFRLDSMRNYQNALMDMAQYRDKEFQVNRQDPFDDAMFAASELTGAGMDNIMSGVSDFSSAAIADTGGGQQSGKTDQLYDQFDNTGGNWKQNYGVDTLGDNYMMPNVG